MKVSVIGQGYVGLTVAVEVASVGHTVIGLDLDKNNIAELTKGKTHIPGISTKKILDLIKTENYTPTTDFNSIRDSNIVIIAVPTPLNEDKKPDLSFLINAAENISRVLSSSALIVNESTSYPGTLRNLIVPIFNNNSSITFEFASAPERIDPGNNNWNLRNTPRVISGISDQATTKAIDFYQQFSGKIFRASSPEVAEASKLFENSFRQINIALANEFSIISYKLGFSAHEAINAASTKPFGFMPFYPGIGVGGHCIPVDPTYLSHAATLSGVNANFIELANETNLNMVHEVISRIKQEMGGSLKSLKIQIAGISYKSGVSDLRESAALRLLAELKNEGSIVSWCDPLVKEYKGSKSSDINPEIDLGLIVTPHEEIDFELWKKHQTKVIDLSSNNKNYGWAKYL